MTQSCVDRSVAGLGSGSSMCLLGLTMHVAFCYLTALQALCQGTEFQGQVNGLDPAIAAYASVNLLAMLDGYRCLASIWINVRGAVYFHLKQYEILNICL